VTKPHEKTAENSGFFIQFNQSVCGGFLVIPVYNDCHNKSPKKKSDDVAGVNVPFKVLFHINGLLDAK
jgi:hypothetical protein